MTTPLNVVPRVLRVASVLLAYRLDELVDAAHLFRPLKVVRPFVARPRGDVRSMPRGERLRLALTELGPIFVKAGQVLSTRRDLVPADIADELSQLQDQVPPFSGAEARAIVERELKAPISQLYARFDETPLASASIAQVHAATLHDGSEVVVKVLRPGIEKRIDRDVKLLRSLGELAQPRSAFAWPLRLPAMTRFLIVDDHPLFREALQSAVRMAHADAEVFEATSIEGAIDVAAAHRDLDLALLDLSLPGTTGFSGLVRFRSAHPKLPVVVVSGHEEPELVAEAMSLGIAGYIPKSTSRKEIADAILRGAQRLDLRAAAPARQARREGAGDRAVADPEETAHADAAAAAGARNDQVGPAEQADRL